MYKSQMVLTRYLYQITYSNMQTNQAINVSARSQAMTALIDQEYTLVIDGKSPQTLVNLLHDYETNPFTTNIAQNPKLVDKYATALLLNGDYLQLSLLLARYIEKNVKITGRALLEKIGDAGKREDLKELGLAVDNYIGSLAETESTAKGRVRSATAANILTVLAKYYINVDFRAIQAVFTISEADVSENGHELKGGFIMLRKEQARRVDCLQDKLKQLAVVSNKMSLLQ